MKTLEEQVGIYTSDVKGHLLSVRISPIRVECVSCMEACYRPEFKTNKEFETAAKTFTEKHGYLDRKIAESVDEIVEFYLANKITRFGDMIQDARGNTACITDVFDLHPDTIADLEK